MVQPVAIAFNQSPDEVFLSPIKHMKTDSASFGWDIFKETLRYSSTVAALISWSSFHCSSKPVGWYTHAPQPGITLA
jgi:hypothetical protein